MGKGKFFVDDRFRTNKLSRKESPVSAEVHTEGEKTKVYTNIHYANAFSKKVFARNHLITHIIFKDSSDNREWEVKRPS